MAVLMFLFLYKTRIVVGLYFYTQFWPALCAWCFRYYGVRVWYKSKSGRSFFDKYILKVPVFGTLLSLSMMTEFCRTLVC